MKTFLKCKNGFYPIDAWEPNCWINIECPTPEDTKFLVDELNIPGSFLNDIADIDERSRIEDEDSWRLIIIRTPYKMTEQGLSYSTVPLGIIFKADIFVSVCLHKTEMISDLINYSQRKQFVISHSNDLVLRFFLSSAVWYLKYLKQINFNIKTTEKELEKSIKNEELQRLFLIEKCLVFFMTSIKSNSILFRKLTTMKSFVERADEELIDDVEVENLQAIEVTKVYSDILSGMMDAYASVISNNLNVIMKQLTSISIILMIPTLIASFFGMNVPNMFVNDAWGFITIMIISFSISIFTVGLFRLMKWF